MTNRELFNKIFGENIVIKDNEYAVTVMHNDKYEYDLDKWLDFSVLNTTVKKNILKALEELIL